MALHDEAPGGQAIGGWGWYSSYPTSRFEGTMAFHYLVPLVNVCMKGILAKAFAGSASVSTFPDMLEREWSSLEEYVGSMLHYEQSREGLVTCSRILELFHSVLDDEVLLLSQLRADSFLARGEGGYPSAAERTFVGCAGLQDRPDLHITLFRCLEAEAGHNQFLKLVDSFQRGADVCEYGKQRPEDCGTAMRSNHKGLDKLANAVLKVLERLILYRCDQHLVCNDRHLERAVLQLTGPLVHCMGRFALPVGLPSGLEQSLELPSVASRLLSMVCRLDLRPMTIRQSWEWRNQGQSMEGSDHASKRALLDLATCHGQPVDARVAVLAFLTEALASQPGLADWLFDSDGDLQGANALSSEAGRVEDATSNTITLDEHSAKALDGYYNGWIVEIRGGKGLGQPPIVVSSYDGGRRIATLSKGWDSGIGMPDKTSQYLISKQLQLRRIVKAFLHPHVCFRGGPGPSSERELNRLRVMEHSLMFVETIWDTAPEERAGIVHGFSDPDCLIWGLTSPDMGKIINKTSRWREYHMRLHVKGGGLEAFRISAAPSGPYAELCDDTDGRSKARIVTKGPQTDDKEVLGWIKPDAKPVAAGKGSSDEVSFWDAIQRHALGSDVRTMDQRCDDGSMEADAAKTSEGVSTEYVRALTKKGSVVKVSEKEIEISHGSQGIPQNYYKEWTLEIVEGKGAGHPPVVIGASIKNSLTLKEGWDPNRERPDKTSKYRISYHFNGVHAKVTMPSTMRRKILPILDADSSECKLFAFITKGTGLKKAREQLERYPRSGTSAKAMYSDLRNLQSLSEKTPESEKLKERVKAELEILDSTLAGLAAAGIDIVEYIEIALDQMWSRLRFPLLYSGMAGVPFKTLGKALPPVQTLHKVIVCSMGLSSRIN